METRVIIELTGREWVSTARVAVKWGVLGVRTAQVRDFVTVGTTIAKSPSFAPMTRGLH